MRTFRRSACHFSILATSVSATDFCNGCGSSKSLAMAFLTIAFIGADLSAQD
jgi:hypothetical protein